MKIERMIWLLIVTALTAWYAGAQSVNNQGTVQDWSITNFPLFSSDGYGSGWGNITQSDTVDLDRPMAIRADAAGAVKAACVGDGGGNGHTLNLVAGEMFPCQVIRLYDTGTDAITITGYY